MFSLNESLHYYLTLTISICVNRDFIRTGSQYKDRKPRERCLLFCKKWDMNQTVLAGRRFILYQKRLEDRTLNSPFNSREGLE